MCKIVNNKTAQDFFKILKPFVMQQEFEGLWENFLDGLKLGFIVFQSLREFANFCQELNSHPYAVSLYKEYTAEIAVQPEKHRFICARQMFSDKLVEAYSEDDYYTVIIVFSKIFNELV